MNGINSVPTKADLIDRSLFLEPERIPKTQRKTEAQLWREINKKKPGILGAIFDILSDALRLKPTVELRELPRMADFCQWGEAISQGMGHMPLVFKKAYLGEIKTNLSEVGINFESGHTGLNRYIKITKMTKSSVSSVNCVKKPKKQQNSPNATNATNDERGFSGVEGVKFEPKRGDANLAEQRSERAKKRKEQRAERFKPQIMEKREVKK